MEPVDPGSTGSTLLNNGQTLVKLIDGSSPVGYKLINVDLVNGISVIDIVDVRRDVANNEDLNKIMHVVIKDSPDSLAAWNVRNGRNLVPLPPAAFTIDPATPKVGDDFQVTLDAGEFAKQIKYNLTTTALVLGTTYGQAFTITSVVADGNISTQRSVVVEIGVKNRWDGVYTVTGPLTDLVNANLVQYTPGWELHLITSGPNSNDMFDNTIWGDYFHPLGQLNSPNPSGYGGFALRVNFNPATNTIASVTNLYGQPNPANTRSAALDPTGVNAVSPNKDIQIKYFMIQSNQSTGTGPRVKFDEYWKYEGPRP